MLMIAGHVTVDVARRGEFVEAHADLVRRARAYPGCLDLSIAGDAVDPARINLMELWESEEILAAWRKACNPPKTDIVIVDEHVRKHHISHSGPPF